MLSFSTAFLWQYILVFLGIGLPLLILLQIWNKRSVVLKISSLYIWKKINKKTIKPGKKKFLSTSLLFQIMILIALLVIALRPTWEFEKAARPEFTIIIDRSASMKTASSPYQKRWHRLKDEINNSLMEIGLFQDDVVHLKFYPGVDEKIEKTIVKDIGYILNEVTPVDMGLNEQSLHSRLSKEGSGKLIFISDSISKDLVEKFKKVVFIPIKDKSVINVGWLRFWITDNKISAVVKNYSTFPININIELKLDGELLSLTQQLPAINANSSFLFVKEIKAEDFKKVKLIELNLTCVGDTLKEDNKIASYRMKTGEIKILFLMGSHRPIIKALNSLGKNSITFAADNTYTTDQLNEFDVLVTSELIPNVATNQIVLSPTKSNEYYQLTNKVIDSKVESVAFLTESEKEITDNILLGEVRGLTVLNNGQVKLIDPLTKTPLLVVWNKNGFQCIVLNFNVNNLQITRLPFFPFLISKIFEKLSKTEFQHWQTGGTVNGSQFVEGSAVFQNNRLGSLNSIKIDENNESILLQNTGLFSFGEKKICVNLLNSSESNIHQKNNAKITRKVSSSIIVKKNNYSLALALVILLLMLGIFEHFFHGRERKRG